MKLIETKIGVALAALCLFFISSLRGQDGWKSIHDNDYPKARQAFDAALKKDSLDEAALMGMLYLAEASQSLPEVMRYGNRLQRLQPDWHLDELFPGAIKTDEYPKVKWPASHASLTVRRLRNEGKILEANDTLAKYFDDYPWHYAGPFKTESQAGLSKEFGPEVEPFDPEQLFLYGSNDSCRWRRLEQLGRPRIGVDLEDAGKGVYYFTQAIQVDREMDLLLRLGIIGGCRLWVDDSLVLSVNEIQMPEPDKHTISLHLWPGKHRVLVKLASQALFSTSDLEYRLDETPLEVGWWMPSASKTGAAARASRLASANFLPSVASAASSKDTRAAS